METMTLQLLWVGPWLFLPLSTRHLFLFLGLSSISFNKPPTDLANDPTIPDVISLLRWPFAPS